MNDTTPAFAGAGSELLGYATILPDPATQSIENPSNGNSIIGYGSPLYRRAVDLNIAGGLIYKHAPTSCELEIIVKSFTRIDDLDGHLFRAMIERTAPSAECAARYWHRCWTDEIEIARIVAARLRGFMPPELIEDASRVAAAVVAGATVTIQRRKAANHAA